MEAITLFGKIIYIGNISPYQFNYIYAQLKKSSWSIHVEKILLEES